VRYAPVSLLRLIWQRRPTVVFSMMGHLNLMLALLKPLLPGGVRLFARETNALSAMLEAEPGGEMWRLGYRWLYRRLDNIVSQSESNALELVRDFHVAPGRVRVIRNPLDIERIGQLAAEPVVSPATVGRPGRKRLLAVGRLGEEKRFAALIRVFSSLTKSAPDWELVILGEGPERDELEEYVRRLGLEEAVFLPGHVGNVSDWFRSADLYVLTSRFEGFPNALLEAMAHGLPAVAVDCLTGPRDIIRPEVDGLLVPPNDDGALTTALHRLMTDPVTRAALAARALEARVRFSLDSVAASWERLFEGVAK
ncbi:MAG: glycosyltransferase family 4 protein, partial [Betaproteobacteria bacterium HGW-Betaproteobacteria-18]